MKVNIINETKNLVVNLISESEFISEYGDFSVSHFYTRKWVAENDGKFVLYGMSGFRKAPNINDIRNKTINQNGSTRYSGHSEEISLDLQLEPLYNCFSNKEMLDLYNYPLSTFHNEFDDLTIEFDIGCAVLYQYYSFQGQSDDMTTFSFLGSRGGNTYYVKGGVKFDMYWEQDAQYMTPALIKPSLENLNNNYVSDRPLHNKTFEFIANEESNFSFTLEAVDTSSFPKSFMENIHVYINGNEMFFEGRYTKIVFDEEGNAYDENGDVINYEGELPIFEIKKNTIEFKPQLQRGDFLCEFTVPTVTMF